MSLLQLEQEPKGRIVVTYIDSVDMRKLRELVKELPMRELLCMMHRGEYDAARKLAHDRLYGPGATYKNIGIGSVQIESIPYMEGLLSAALSANAELDLSPPEPGEVHWTLCIPYQRYGIPTQKGCYLSDREWGLLRVRPSSMAYRDWYRAKKSIRAKYRSHGDSGGNVGFFFDRMDKIGINSRIIRSV